MLADEMDADWKTFSCHFNLKNAQLSLVFGQQVGEYHADMEVDLSTQKSEHTKEYAHQSLAEPQ